MSRPKRGLGRGLDALLTVAEEGARTIAVERLRPNRLQPRTEFDETGLAELAASIEAQGVMQPILVSADPDGTYSIIAGERRWRAAQRAGLVEVPVIVRAVADDRERLELALMENLQRTDLNALEEAEAYGRLRQEFGLSQDEVARRVGKSRSTVANCLRLLKLPDAIRQLLRDGQLTAGQARPLVSIADPAKQMSLARRAAEAGLTARQIETAAAGIRPRRRAKPAVDANTAQAVTKLTQHLQTRVEIRRMGRGGNLQIRFNSEEELIRLYDLLLQTGDKR